MEDEDSIVYFLTLFTFAVIFGLCYIRRTFTFFDRIKIPKTSTPSFPLGNVSDVVFQNVTLSMHLWKYYNKFKRKKCKVGGFFLFLKPAVVVVDDELIRLVLDDNSEYFKPMTVEEPKKYNSELLESVLKNFSKSWRIVAEDLSNTDVNLTLAFEKYLVTVAEEDIFCATGVRKSLAPASKFLKFTQIFSIAYPFFKSDNDKKESCDFIKLVEENLVFRKKNDVKQEDVIQNLLDRGLSAQEIVPVLQGLVKKLETALDLLLLGLFELAVNREIQEDLRGEILRFQKLKGGSSVTLEELDSLTYLETVVCEILRKYPVTPLVCKKCQKPYTQGATNLPENLIVFVSIFGIHHDPKNYTNPEILDPDRFSEENVKFVDPAKYLPFGRKLDKTEFNFELIYVKLVIKLGLFQLLRKLRLSLGNRSVRSLTFDESHFELKPKGEMWFKLETIDQ